MVTVVAPAVEASAPICLMVTAPVSVAAEAAIFKAFKGLVPPPIIPPMPTVPEPLIMVKLSAFPAAVVALIVESKSIFPAPVVPVVTVIALGIPSIFGGAIITEQVFKVNGIGQQLINAIYANDLPTVQTITFMFAVLIVVFNLIADILYGILDPRIRYD